MNIKEEAGKVKGEAKSGGAEKDEQNHSTRPKDESNGYMYVSLLLLRCLDLDSPSRHLSLNVNGIDTQTGTGPLFEYAGMNPNCMAAATAASLKISEVDFWTSTL